MEDFAILHNLEMVVIERHRPVDDPTRFSAHFADTEVKEDGILRRVYGDGSRPEQAIYAYAQKISFSRIIIDAMKPTRREIEVPRIIT